MVDVFKSVITKRFEFTLTDCNTNIHVQDFAYAQRNRTFGTNKLTNMVKHTTCQDITIPDKEVSQCFEIIQKFKNRKKAPYSFQNVYAT